MLKIARALDETAQFRFSLFPHGNNYFEYATKVRLAAIADQLKLRDWEWDEVVGRIVEIIVKEVYPDIYAALNGVLSQLFTTVTLQRQPETLAAVRTWNEFPCEYYFLIESPQPQ
jgi:hypothetical protein